MEDTWAVILAAGKGERMRSRLPKVLHPLCGRPMIDYILDAAAAITPQLVMVIGHGAELVRETCRERCHFVLQEELRGTGHALSLALEALPAQGRVLVLCGDTPLLISDHLKQLVAAQEGHAAAVATTCPPDPAGYGRIIRGKDGSVSAIVEESDATSRERAVAEINTGSYCFDLSLLRRYISDIAADNVQGEYYLTDIIALFNRDGHRVRPYLLADYRLGLGINNRVQLAEASALMRARINERHMLAGVTMIDPGSVYADLDVSIGPDTVIYPGSVLLRGTSIGASCHIGPGVYLQGVSVGDNAVVMQVVLEDSSIPSQARIVPGEAELT